MAQASRDAANMVSFPTLDLLLFTFNCAKAPIDVPVFAGHLQQAFASHTAAPNTSTLPDLVVFSLQEVAPLGHAFAGSYFLNPYFLRFGEALSLAATQIDGYEFEGEDDEDREENAGEGSVQMQQGQARSQRGPKQTYHFVRQAHVGMTAILMFARDMSAIHDVEVAHCGFGVADMGNKGAVGLRIAYGRKNDFPESEPGKLTFVATHLAAMEWNVRRRNANWRSIVAGLTFSNPKDVIVEDVSASAATAGLGRGHQGRNHDEAASAPRSAEEEAEAEAAADAGDGAWLLLGQQQHEIDVRHRLQDLSIFRPDNLLFVAGDLNYRIGDEAPPADAAFPTASTWPEFFKRDQLTHERLAGRTFHGMTEAPIDFPPTYKYDILSDEDIKAGAVPDNNDEIQQNAGSPDPDTAAPIPWQYATHRWPSWCDRVLYLDVPEWAKQQWRRGQKAVATPAAAPEVKVTSYQSLPLMRTSDHQPVYFRAQIPLLPKNLYERTEEESAVSESDSGAPVDPRIHSPVAIDTDAWARRSRARNRERIAGAGMLLFNTKEGAALMVTTIVVLVGLYWAWVGLL
ncbi:hypothetical protein SCUCBS95973_007267 [Sporothrix curviconia]|uniref:Inositol polyphosphate-related phosphatase domain-containing protein n=1 Tax=Sporothrix curviconia TaxID=1260050 RepID=A0ABP0CDP2_9PEZI